MVTRSGAVAARLAHNQKVAGANPASRNQDSRDRSKLGQRQCRFSRSLIE